MGGPTAKERRWPKRTDRLSPSSPASAAGLDLQDRANVLLVQRSAVGYVLKVLRLKEFEIRIVGA
jgi:hypothetical protein